MSRNPQLFVHQEQSQSKKYTITDFFGKLRSLCAKLNLIAEPRLIYNVDETGITVLMKPTGDLTQVG